MLHIRIESLISRYKNLVRHKESYGSMAWQTPTKRANHVTTDPLIAEYVKRS